MPRTRKPRRYPPANGTLAARFFDKETGDLIELYATDGNIMVRTPKEELNQPEYWKPPHRRKNAKL